jgi:hypothetical protein
VEHVPRLFDAEQVVHSSGVRSYPIVSIAT